MNKLVVSENLKPSFSSTLTPEQPVSHLFRAIYQSHLPYAAVIDRGRFLGNIWLAKIQARLQAIKPEDTIERLIDDYPDVFSSHHYLSIHETVEWEDLQSFVHNIVPVIDDDHRLIGHIDLIHSSFEAAHGMFTRPDERGRSVIIAEDDADVLDMLESGMRKRGFECRTATNGAKALELLRNLRECDLLVTDLKMPEMNGAELIRKAREIDQDIVIFVVTGTTERQAVIDCLKSGADDFFDKPARVDRLVSAFEEREQQVHNRRQENIDRIIYQLLSYSGRLMMDPGVPLRRKFAFLAERFAGAIPCGVVSISKYLKEEQAFVVLGSTNKNICDEVVNVSDTPVLQRYIGTDQPVIIRDPNVFPKKTKGSYNSKSALVTPLYHSGKFYGFITAADRHGFPNFTENDLRIFRAIGPSVSLLIDYSTLLANFKVHGSPFLRDTDETRDDLVSLAMLGELATVVTHDVANPLAGAIGFTESLQSEQKRLSETGSSSLEKLSLCLDRIDRINQIMSRFVNRRRPSGSKSFLLTSAIDACMILLERKIDTHGVDVQKQIDRDFEMKGEQIHLEQILCNLISNAIDAVSETDERQIIIRGFRQTGGEEPMVIEVSDSGPGLSEDRVDQVFDRFSTTKRGRRNIGMGLYICRAIVESYGGHISYYRNKGGLPTFGLSLPR